MSLEFFPPSSFLIGAQKAGTTTLAYLLDQHPSVVLSRPKEPQFFTYNWGKGLSWYRTKFPASKASSVLVDASTTYSMAPLQSRTSRLGRKAAIFENVPERIHSVNPRAKFIYLLRDPVERTYSGYWHNVRTGRENRSFREAVTKEPFYFEVSDYFRQLLLWLDYFPLDSFHFALFEDLVESPEHVANESLAFFGLDPQAASIRLDSTKNKSYDTTRLGRMTNRMLAKHPGFSRCLVASVELIIPPGVKQRIKNVLIKAEPVPEMKLDDRVFLIDYFRERNQLLESKIGLPLDRWQR